ncbi:class I SAM-dependent methyltransferase [Halococcus salsus]|uniref:class I SAM-dependent methyltransferase n=1 Tax=Halococcus salsus TaxID=2162894 RepID=UPI0013575AD6|nr:class I SAM-dependent methyltransferase [Halococcus salsus]
MTGDDPLGWAVYDHHRDEWDEPLVDRDGTATREQPIQRFYFDARDPDREVAEWEASWLSGPALDIGAGAGRDTLHFQEKFETVALEVSERLVETMRERGVRDARLGDMFALREEFERDRFRSAFAFGTQVGLAGSMQGLRRFLGDLAFVTTPDGTALLHGYDPDREATVEILGYRADPTPGLAHRVYHTTYRDQHETLLFRLFSPDRLREAVVGTGWQVAEVRRFSAETYVAALEKR